MIDEKKRFVAKIFQLENELKTKQIITKHHITANEKDKKLISEIESKADIYEIIYQDCDAKPKAADEAIQYEICPKYALQAKFRSMKEAHKGLRDPKLNKHPKKKQSRAKLNQKQLKIASEMIRKNVSHKFYFLAKNLISLIKFFFVFSLKSQSKLKLISLLKFSIDLKSRFEQSKIISDWILFRSENKLK